MNLLRENPPRPLLAPSAFSCHSLESQGRCKCNGQPRVLLSVNRAVIYWCNFGAAPVTDDKKQLLLHSFVMFVGVWPWAFEAGECS